MSLRILRGMDLGGYSGDVGIMIHANTSANFQNLVAEYPLEKGRCPFHNTYHGQFQCEKVESIRKRTVRMCDSGVFTKTGAPKTYEELFRVYERADVEYGIIIDHLRDANRTLKSAREALQEFSLKPRRFELVAVAQGRNVKEYLDCYAKLRAMGFNRIAVGGLLNRRKNTARYVYVQGGRLFKVLDALRSRYPKDWMFALGCYHPRRHADMERYGIFGSDYKGWIFNYEEKNKLGVIAARRSRLRQVRRFLQAYVYADDRKVLPYRGRQRGTKDLAVVACSKAKIWDSGYRGGAYARDSYQGTFFRMAATFAETHADDWVILSARHGFLNPKSRLSGPYDQRISTHIGHAETQRLRHQVIQKGLHSYGRIIVFGGADYVNAVEVAFSPFDVDVVSPLQGARMGTKLGLLKRSDSLQSLLHAARLPAVRV